MIAHLPILIVVLPIAGAIAVPVVGLLSTRGSRALALVILALTHLASLAALREALTDGPWSYELGGWAPPWGIEYVVDALGGGMATLVSLMALLTGVYAASNGSSMRSTIAQALHLLLTAGLLGIVVTGDAFNLYVFLEISALSGYALLCGDGDRAAVATFRYLLMGTIAAAFYLLGLGHLYAITGTLNLADLAARVPHAPEGGAVAMALALIVVGLGIKIALFPLHGWLPDVYTYAPPAYAAFAASTMSKVGVYVLLRVVLVVFEGTRPAGVVLDLLAAAAGVAIIAGSAMALVQRDVRRMLAYSSVGQMGYIVLGVGLGTPLAITGALLHVANHAVMKACLFMASGNVARHAGLVDMASYGGVARRLPLTMAAFVVAAASMMGLPPTGGFFSKWYLLLGALERGAWPYVVVIALGSLLTVVYLFRVIETAIFGATIPESVRPAPPEPADRRAGHGWELPLSAVAPTTALAILVLGLGLFNQELVTRVLDPALGVLKAVR